MNADQDDPKRLIEQLTAQFTAMSADMHADLVSLQLAMGLLLAAQEGQAPGFSELAKEQLNDLLGRLGVTGRDRLPDGTLLGERIRTRFHELLTRADEVARARWGI